MYNIFAKKQPKPAVVVEASPSYELGRMDGEMGKRCDPIKYGLNMVEQYDYICGYNAGKDLR